MGDNRISYNQSPDTNTLYEVFKGQALKYITDMAGANLKSLFMFDATGSTTTLADKAPYAGGPAHTATLRASVGGSAVAASTLSPVVRGVLPTLSFNGTTVWDVPSSGDFSFGNGSGTDIAVSVVCLFNLASYSTQPLLVGKINGTGNMREWMLFVVSNGTLSTSFYGYDSQSNQIGRTSSAAIVAGTWQTAVLTYDGSKTSAGIKIYVNGVRIDNADHNNGSYVGITSGTALYGSYLGSGASGSEQFTGQMALASLMDVALTASQVAALDAQLRSLVGTLL